MKKSLKHKYNFFIKSKKLRALSLLTALILVIELFDILPLEMGADLEASAASMTTGTIQSAAANKLSEYGITTTNNTSFSIGSDYWYDFSGNETVSYVDYSSCTVTQENGAIGYKISFIGDLPAVESTDKVSDNGFSGTGSLSAYTANSAASADPIVGNTDLFYSVSTDTELGTDYRTYYISTADQLYMLLKSYSSYTTTNNSSIASNTNFKSLVEYNSSYNYPKMYKIKICLLSDINMNMQGFGFSSSARFTFLEIDGNGHSIYNYKQANSTYIFPTKQYLMAENFTISHSYQATALFGGSNTYSYFYNVSFDECVLNSSAATGFFFANSYYCVYVDNCTISDCVVYGYGSSGHFSCFASYNSSKARVDCTTQNKYNDYYSDMPTSIESVECNFYNGTSTPDIFEDSCVIDSYVYDVGLQHSGVFISCTQGGLICRRCFTNGTIYAQSRLGVFIGAVIGCGPGFNMAVDSDADIDNDGNTSESETVLVNSYFESCYTSGSIEGSDRLGGFVGMIFDDSRQYGSDTRGVAVFNNCYSTSSVGMQYAGEIVGGFVGSIRGNVGTAYSASGDTGSTDYINGNSLSTGGNNDANHLFINCYAAGEVGGITTSTTGGDSTTIGGFVGEYRYDHYILFDRMARFYNCYYDMQTTAMREKDIGDPGTKSTSSLNYYVFISNSASSGTKPYDALIEKLGSASELPAYLMQSMDGITGVYTVSSDVKTSSLDTHSNSVVKGLTYDETSDCVSMTDTSDWTYVKEYYPILSAFVADSASSTFTQQQQNFVANYAYASAAAVQLNHYDTVLTDEGYEKNASLSASENAITNDELAAQAKKFDKNQLIPIYEDDSNSDFMSTYGSLDEFYTAVQEESISAQMLESLGIMTLVYDTIRDITRKFTFTSADKDGNYSTDTANRTLTWDLDNQRNEEDSFYTYMDKEENGFNLAYSAIASNETDNDNGGTAITDSSEVNFNPLTLDIKLDASTGQYKCYDFSPGKQWVVVRYGSDLAAQGVRNLRLLPTAYLSASGMATISIDKDDNNTVFLDLNYVKYNYSGNFDHTAGVAYAITDKTRMSNEYNSTYSAHTLSEYVSGTTSTSDTGSFAFYGRYNLTDSSSDNTVGYMVDEKFTQTSYENESENGQTIVRIYKMKIEGDETNGYEFVKDYEVTDGLDINSDLYKKWTGQTKFDKDDEMGYYYMVYYWQLDDGRFLTDTRLVYLTKDTCTVTLTTGILDEKRTTVDTDPDIDQLVTVDSQTISSYTTTGGVGSGNYLQPSDYTSDPATQAAEDYSYLEFNEPYEYNGETYYCNTSTVTFGSTDSLVAWQRDSKYFLSTLIIQAKTKDGDWEEVTLSKTGTNGALIGSSYNYISTTYTVSPNSEYKTFNVSVNPQTSAAFELQQLQSSDQLVNFIDFNFKAADTGSAAGTQVSTVADLTSIRVIALFSSTDTTVTASKSVFFGETDNLNTINDKLDVVDSNITDPNSDIYYESLDSYDSERSVDDFDVDDDDRLAVLSGDTLTYRMTVKNNGYYKSGKVVVSDTIPDGCTYVDGSMKIYKQTRDITNYAAYSKISDVTDDTDFKCKISADTLTYTIPAVDHDEQYYVEYQVTVNQIAASNLTEILTNTASWEYVSSYTDSSSAPPVSVDMSEDFTSINAKRTYSATFTITESGCSIVKIMDTIPVGYDLNSISLSDDSGKTYTLGTSQTGQCVYVESINGTNIESYAFTKDTTYTFIIDVSPSIVISEETGVDTFNKFEVDYSTDGGYTSYANMLLLGEGITNQVETDVTHLYLNISKQIDSSDPSQTFIFKVEYYEEGNTLGSPDGISYVNINCTQQDSSGSFIGSRFIQTDRRGTYVISEITDWSNTDYDSVSASYENADYPYKESYNISESYDVITVVLLTDGTTLDTPYLTKLGSLEEGTYTTSVFKNTDSEYAYRSGQAYTVNLMQAS